MSYKTLSIYTLLVTIPLIAATERPRVGVYFGGAGADVANAVALDADGNAYVAGSTTRTAGRRSAFVAKTKADGTEILWTAELAGVSAEAVAVDGQGGVWAAGAGFLAKLNGADGQVERSLETGNILALAVDAGGAVYTAGDGFVTKYAGFEKVYTAKVAGIVRGLAVDGAGAAYVAFGETVGRLTPDGGAMDYTLELGFAVNAIAIDGMGAAYVTGGNAMVAKVTPAGDAVAFRVALGGVLEQEGRSIALDGLGNLYVAGWTSSSDFARARGWHGDKDGFLVKLNGAGEVVETAFAGTAARDAMHGVAVAASGDVYVAGWTEAAGIGEGPLAQLQGGTDGVLLRFAAAGANRAITGTTTGLTTTPAGNVGIGQNATLTATVAPAGATGKVTFYDGQSVVGVATLSGTTATLVTTQLPVGARSLRAYYQGDVNFSASTSANVALTVNVIPSLTLTPAGGTTVGIAGEPSSLATGDFNGDGKTDLAVTLTAANTVTIQLSNGSGGFTTAAGSPIAVGLNPFSIAVGDFNGDGKQDLAVANLSGDTISILLGNGNGTFTAGAAIPMAGGPATVRAVDLNLDGHVDLVTANLYSGTFGVMLGNGAGGFTAGPGNQTSLGSGSFAGSIVAADFNADGKPDVAVTNYVYDVVEIFLGNGLGGFTLAPGGVIVVGKTPTGVEAGDFNGDGKLDLAITNFAGTTLSILLGNGTGGFTATTAVDTGQFPRTLTLLDFNFDGKLDIAVAVSGTNSVALFQGNGTGGFTTASGSPFGGNNVPMGVVAGDFNGDGRLDVAVANRSTGVATIVGVGTPAGGGATPLVVGMSPTAPTATPQTLTVTVRDSDGFNNLSRLYFLINTSATVPVNSCHGYYDRGSASFYLYNDALTTLQGPLAAGAAGTLQNGQCVLYGTGSGIVSESGIDMVLNVKMGLQGAYLTANENVYFYAVDQQSLGSGWVQTGTWSLGTQVGNVAPTIVSVTPASTTSAAQSFSMTVRDLNGAANIARIYFLVNTSPTVPANSCHGFYDRPTNLLYLYNDSLSVLQGPLTPGSAGTLSNSQCAVNGATTALVSSSGTDVVLNLGMTITGAYTANSQNFYLYVTDAEANGTGWVQSATWTVAGSPVAPTLQSANPPAPTGSPQTFVFVARDGNGFTDINRMYFVVNTSATVPVNSCHGFYDRASGAFFLYNDSLTGLLGPLTPGVAGTLANSQCSIDGTNSSVTGAGNDLTIRMNMSLLGSYGAGQQKMYVWIVDRANTGNGTGWLLASTWTGTVALTAPTLVSATPATTTAAAQTFVITARDANGAADIGRIYFQLHSSATVPAGTCHGFYDRIANSIFLYNDSLSSLTAFTLGTAGSVQNSQCRINGSGTTVTAAGTDVVLNLNITRQGSYVTGAKNLFLYIVDNSSLGTGWLTGPGWTL